MGRFPRLPSPLLSRSSLVVVVVVVLIGTSGAGVVGAQDAGAGNSTNATNTTNGTAANGSATGGAGGVDSGGILAPSSNATGPTTNSSGGTPANGSGTGPGTGPETVNTTNGTNASSVTGDMGAEVPTVGSPGTGTTGTQGTVTNLFVGFAEGLAGGANNVLSGVSDLLVGLPAPGSPDDPVSWVNPGQTSGWWPRIMEFHLALTGLCMVGVMFRALTIVGYSNKTAQRSEIRKLYRGAGLIVLGAFILGLALHLGDAVATGIAPSGSEFLETPGNAARLGIGVAVGAVLLGAKSLIVLVGLGILIAIWMAVHFLYALWPVFALAYMFRFGPIRWFGLTGITAMVGLILLRVFQAIILRFLFVLPINPLSAAGGSALLSLFVIIAGLLVALIWLPKHVLKSLLPRTVQNMANDAGDRVGNAMPDSIEDAKQRIGDARSRFENTVRGSASSRNDETPEPTYVGRVSNTRASRAGTGADSQPSGPSTSGAGTARSGGAGSSDQPTSTARGIDAQRSERARREINRTYR